MNKTVSVEEAVARAQREQEARVGAVRALAETRQHLAEARAEAERRRRGLEAELVAFVGDAEAADVRSFNAAITAGWTAAELRRIGLEEPQKAQRVRKRAKAAARGSASQQSTDAGPAEGMGATSDGAADQGVSHHE